MHFIPFHLLDMARLSSSLTNSRKIDESTEIILCIGTTFPLYTAIGIVTGIVFMFQMSRTISGSTYTNVRVYM